jgi:hypothetical protein
MHSPAFGYNIGIAYQAMGDAPSALRWLRAYLREVPAADDRAAVTKMISGLEARLQAKGVQQATVLSTPDGATARVDGAPVGVTPWTGELAPGRHRLTLQVPGYEDHDDLIEVLAHRADDFLVTLRPVSAAAAPAPAPVSAKPPPATTPSVDSQSGPPRVSPLTWVALGGGALCLGGALGFELSRASAAKDAKSASQVDFRDKADAAASRQTAARVLAGVGGALAVTGGVLLVLDLSASPTPEQAQVGLGCTAEGCLATGSASF